MALLKRLISTVSMLQKALIRLTPMLFSIFLQKSQSFTLLIFDFFFFAIWFCNEKSGRKDCRSGTPHGKAVKKKLLKVLNSILWPRASKSDIEKVNFNMSFC